MCHVGGSKEDVHNLSMEFQNTLNILIDKIHQQEHGDTVIPDISRISNHGAAHNLTSQIASMHISITIMVVKRIMRTQNRVISLIVSLKQVHILHHQSLTAVQDGEHLIQKTLVIM